MATRDDLPGSRTRQSQSVPPGSGSRAPSSVLRPTDVTLAVIMASPMAPETTMVGPPCDLLETCHGVEGGEEAIPRQMSWVVSGLPDIN